jgi:hypothetical protein
MNPQITDSYSNKSYRFAAFDGLKDLEEQGQKAVQEQTAANSGFLSEWGPNSNMLQNYDRNFVGTSRDTANKGNFIEYINRANLETAISSFDEMLTKVDMGGAFEKAKMIITADSRGVFDFSLASKGLYRLREYYSEEMKNESPREFFPELPGIVPLDNVYQDALEQFWYTTESGKKYLLTPRQKGTTYMLEINPSAQIIVDDQGLEYTDPISYNDFTLEFATTTKKSYIMFEKKGGKAKFVDLYVGIGGLSELTYEGMLARALPLLLAARFFEQVGIRTRVIATRMYKDGGSFFTVTYPIKDYGQDLDFNWLAINSSDPRWFRWNLWKYVSALSYTDKLLKTPTRGYGSTVYGGDELLEVFNRYKNWYFQEMKEGRLKPLEIDRNLMIAGGLPNPGNDDLTSRSGKQKIQNEFYRVLDIVDFQFNKPEKAAARIYKRFQEDSQYANVSKNRLDTDVKEYIIATLRQAYSYPARGEYATEKERQDVLEDEFDKALDGTLNYLATV